MGETRQRQGEREARAAPERRRMSGSDAGEQDLDQTMRVNEAPVVPLPGGSEMGNSIPQRKRWSRRMQRRKRDKQAPEEVNQVKDSECILSFVQIPARTPTCLRCREKLGMQNIQRKCMVSLTLGKHV